MGQKRTYAIGDIHGHLDRLHEVLSWIDADRQRGDGEGQVVHVGDFVDRGPDSAGVIQFLIDGLSRGQPWTVLRGNHDRMMSFYLDEPQRKDPILRSDYSWLHHRLGGLTTLASYGAIPMNETNPKAPKGKHWFHPEAGSRDVLTSYGIDPDSLEDRALWRVVQGAVPVVHRLFLAGLDTIYQTEDVVFVHAGIRPGISIVDQVEDDLIWIRDPFLNDRRDHGPLIIHGHSPISAPTHYGNRVNIDSGVAYGGPLTAVVVEGRDIWHLTQKGRVPLLSP